MMRCKIHLTTDSVSVARRLLESVPRSLELVAPEKLSGLTTAVDNLSLEIYETSSRLHSCRPSPPTIRLSSRVVELLWAQTYAFTMYYTKELAGVRPDGQQINPRRKPEVDKALDLLKWAILEVVSPADRPWPAGCASPQADPSTDELLGLTDDLALMGAAFILHHELAHIRLNHSAPTDIDQEREADYAAADWILDGTAAGTEQFRKRALGISVALLYLISSGVYTGDHDGTKHPKDYNRLLFTLERHVAPDTDDVWAFVNGMLDLLIQDAGSVASRGPFDDFHEACNALVDHLAGLDAPQGRGRTRG